MVGGDDGDGWCRLYVGNNWGGFLWDLFWGEGYEITAFLSIHHFVRLRGIADDNLNIVFCCFLGVL